MDGCAPGVPPDLEGCSGTCVADRGGFGAETVGLGDSALGYYAFPLDVRGCGSRTMPFLRFSIYQFEDWCVVDR